MTWTIVGQDAAISVLSRALGGGRVSHAYLFAGPGRVGKSTTALEFAQALNCTGDDPPCGACRQCERIAAGKHADLEILGIGGLCGEEQHDHARDNSRDIRICQVRRLEEVVSRAPFEGRTRAVIIDPADAMNDLAANALLKTLEEPPPGVVIVLVTEREEKLLPTIRSRARRIGFWGQPREAIERALRTHWGADAEQAATLSRLAGGRLGWAVAALRDASVLTDREEALDRAEALASATIGERFAYASTLGGGFSRDREGTHAVLDAWQAWWRDLLLVSSGRPEQATHQERLDTLRALASQCQPRDCARALRAIAEAGQQLDENASPVLALESMMLALPAPRANAVASRLTRS